ncbi:hypothetical protein SKAU_G00188860 [Synaphobranchus kaupii]|uniref:Uncharacterized protein n=1 Tax=Synaphobranchus kaupii TaxID=118154 RepID=A0A9Q1IV00_SYNKA|nr:hypothetical protein SKAU_G00188860 [Synaphobranchus kaupii]
MIQELKQELSACKESASAAHIHYEELKESSNQQIEEAAQNAWEYLDLECERYCSIVQAFREELATLTNICKERDRRLVAMAEESERREEELEEMAFREQSEQCERTDKELAAMAFKFEKSKKNLADMRQLCLYNEEKMEDMEKLYEITMNHLVDETIDGQDRLESLETMTQRFNNKEEELAAMVSRLEVSEKKLAAMSELLQAEDKLQHVNPVV